MGTLLYIKSHIAETRYKQLCVYPFISHVRRYIKFVRSYMLIDILPFVIVLVSINGVALFKYYLEKKMEKTPGQSLKSVLIITNSIYLILLIIYLIKS